MSIYFKCNKLKDDYLSDNCKAFQLIFNERVFYIDEKKCIEILVSLIRAYSDISFIESNSRYCYLFQSVNEYEIIKKEVCELCVSIKKQNIIFRLCGYNIFESDYEDLCFLTDEIYDFLNKNYCSNIIDIREFNPSYIEHMLGIDLPYLKSVEYEHDSILSLELYNIENQEIRLHADNHKYYEMLKTGIITSSYSGKSNYIMESEEERLKKILAEYSDINNIADRFVAIVYNDEMFVRDGTHRLTCLYFLYGNIEVPVMRIRFSKNYYSYSLYRNHKSGEKK